MQHEPALLFRVLLWVFLIRPVWGEGDQAHQSSALLSCSKKEYPHRYRWGSLILIMWFMFGFQEQSGLSNMNYGQSDKRSCVNAMFVHLIFFCLNICWFEVKRSKKEKIKKIWIWCNFPLFAAFACKKPWKSQVTVAHTVEKRGRRASSSLSVTSSSRWVVMNSRIRWEPLWLLFYRDRAQSCLFASQSFH